ncbi:MAG TPA: family 10 glycosylhydrolase, partial [Steroidobacteraceae bacterium]|nr:family 10 glycosylhydrolase [Steroidobacteraceae bacterium]
MPSLKRTTLGMFALVALASSSIEASNTLPTYFRWEAKDAGNADEARFDAQHDLRIALPFRPAASKGTLLLWVTPDWSTPRMTSKPLLTMRWKDGRSSYLAISEGWWEPTGIQQLYFVISNQEHAHCSGSTRLKRGYLSLVAVTWNAETGSCAIFINDEKIVQSSVKMNGDYLGDGEVIVGRDTGSTDQRGRVAEGWLNSFTWLPYAMTEKQVVAEYERHLGGALEATRHKWKWLGDAISYDPPGAGRQHSGKIERRALFDESNEWALSKANTDRILSMVKRAGFNIYVPCVWHGAGTYYPTSFAVIARGIKITHPQYDSLQYLIERAHRLNIEVHPWITIARRDDNQYPQFVSNGTPDGAYDIHNQAFQLFISQLVDDLIKRYDIDGINLDYIRAMGICKSMSCAVDYKQRTGRDLLNDIQAGGTDGIARTSLVRWQDDAVTAIVRNIKTSRDQHRPGALLSVDGNVVNDSDRPLQGRNELRWLRAGLVDVVFDMDYDANLDLDRLDQIMTVTPGKVIPVFANFDRKAGVATSRPGWVIN